jgi:hypothetical protein
MEKGNYRGAAITLMEVCGLIPNSKGIEYLYYCLGQCHFRLGQLHTATYWFSMSLDLYRKGITTNTGIRYRRCYRDVIELYCKVLRIDGNAETADKVIKELDFGS